MIKRSIWIVLRNGKPTSSSYLKIEHKRWPYLDQSLSILDIPYLFGFFAIGDPGTGKKPETLTNSGFVSSKNFIVFSTIFFGSPGNPSIKTNFNFLNLIFYNSQ